MIHARTFGIALAIAFLSGCGGDDDGNSSVVNAPSAVTSVTLAPGSATVSTGSPLAIGVSVTNADRSAGNGTVVLSSGGYSTAPVPVSSGQASVTIPAGVLAIGTTTIAATFTPAGGSTAGTGTAVVTVTAAAAPSVTAQSTDLLVNGHPFTALPVPNGLIVSVTANDDAGSRTGLAVFAGASPTQLTPKCFQRIAYPNGQGLSHAYGLAATPNGGGLALAAEDAGLILVDRQQTIAGCTGATTQVPQGTLASQQGSFDVAVTPDGRYAFVANEYGVVANDSTGAPIKGNVGVVALSYDASGALTGGQLIGQIGTGGQAIAGVTISPDGRRLYVTSEVARSGTAVSATGNTILAHGGCLQAQGAAPTTYGLLTVIDVAKAEAKPGSGAIIATVASGCSPVRAVESADQQVLWVAARGDNRVLAFSTQSLETTPDNALIGYGDTGGVAPVGLQLFAGGKLLAVANSNRFATPSAVGNLTIMNAVPVQPTVLRTVSASYFPRTITLAPDGTTLFLTDYDGGRVQIVSTQSGGGS